MPENWSSSVDLHLDIDAGAGRRAGLEAALRAAIRDGRLAAGSPLPSTRVLARELGLARGTVSAAYDQLVAEGHLTARPGSGTAVAEVPRRPAPRAVPAAARPREPRHDLRPGRPDVGAFPVRAWLASTRRVLDRTGPDLYAAGDPRGRLELRTALAEHLGRTRGVLTGPDRIVVTAGYHQAAALLGRVLRESGVASVAMEDPAHEHYRSVVRRSGLDVVPLPVDASGARVGELDGRVGAVFLTPSHQYPTGVPLHPARRQAVCAWARSTGGLIVEDDYDGEFRYDRQPVGALQGIAPEEVVYCGSVSKTLGPGLRLGWTVLPARLVEPMVLAKEEADLYTESPGQAVLADLITAHAYDRHIRGMRMRYRKRRALLAGRLGPDADVRGVPAGLHVLVALDGEAQERRVLAECAAAGVAVKGLSGLYADGGEGRPGGVLVGYAASREAAYPAAVDAFVSAMGRATASSGVGRDMD